MEEKLPTEERWRVEAQTEVIASLSANWEKKQINNVRRKQRYLKVHIYNKSLEKG